MNEIALDCSSKKKLSGGYLDALKRGNWLYVYMTTVETADVLIDGRHLPEKLHNNSSLRVMRQASTGKVLVMGKKSTMGFMSIFGDAYLAGRGYADSNFHKDRNSTINGTLNAMKSSGVTKL